jgi:hypothetical protein
MKPIKRDEWSVIESLLPEGWQEAAREKRAFRRARYTKEPASLLRLLLFHAVNSDGLRETVAQARASGIASMSQVALLKRLRTSSAWLAWMGMQLCQRLREQPRLPEGLRPRAVDSTTVQGPANQGTDWRVHYALDLVSLTCDWFELTDAHGGELLERTPFRKGDVLLADRNYLSAGGVRKADKAGAHVLIRLRWKHSVMQGKNGKGFHALAHAKKLRVGKVGSWPVRLLDPKGQPIQGRVVALRLPAPLAAQAERKASKKAAKKGKRLDPRSLQATHFVMVFTTLPRQLLSAQNILELYRYRWQIELAFKRLKQLLRLGRLPHKDPAAAQGWIHAKLLIALLLETLFRNARALSPWGFPIKALPSRQTVP